MSHHIYIYCLLYIHVVILSIYLALVFRGFYREKLFTMTRFSKKPLFGTGSNYRVIDEAIR